MPFVNCCSPHWPSALETECTPLSEPTAFTCNRPSPVSAGLSASLATADLGRVRRGWARSFQTPVKHLSARPRMVWNVLGRSLLTARQTQPTERWPGRPLPSTSEKSDVGPTPHLGKSSSNCRGLRCIQYMLGVKRSVFLPQAVEKQVLAPLHRSLPTGLT